MNQPELAQLLNAYRKSKAGLENINIFDADKIDSLLAHADEKLSASGFSDTALVREVLGEEIAEINDHEIIQEIFDGFRRFIWEAAYAAPCRGLAELGAKAKIWGRLAPDDLSKSPDGTPDEFLLWSLVGDLNATVDRMNLPKKAAI